MPRRLISVALATVLVLAAAPIQGCSLLAGKTAEDAAPFTTDYALSQDNIGFFIDNDSVETVITRNPFYAGSRQLPGQKTAAYDEARAKKVAAILADADKLVVAARAAEPAMATLRSNYVRYLQQVRKEEPGFTKYAGSSITTAIAFGTKEILAERAYTALGTVQGSKAYARSVRDYLKTMKAVEYGSLMLEDADVVTMEAALAIEVVSAAGKAKAATAAYDAQAAKDVEAVLKALEPVAAGITRVNDGLTQLASGDYYFNREALNWMDAEMAKLKPQVDKLAVRDGLDAAEVENIKAYYSMFEQWNASMREHFASIDTSGLVKVAGVDAPGIFAIEGVAYAAEDGAYTPGADYGASIAAMSQEPPAPPSGGFLSATWGAIKGAAKGIRTAAGVTMDAAAIGVRNTTRVVTGIYYGNTRAEIWNDMKKNAKEIGDNYNKGISGATVLTDAKTYVEGTETGAGKAGEDFTKWAVTNTWGKGKVADASGWAVGGLVKITTGMFTGLAKGIYTVSNPKSSTAEIAGGVVEIGLSAIGGSKIFIKASQIPGILKGGFQGVKNAGNVVISLANSAGNKQVQVKLTAEMAELLAKNKVTQDQVKKLVSNSLKLEVSAAVEAMMKANRAAYIKAIRDLIAKGGAGFKTNFGETVRSSLEDLTKKGFDSTLKGFLDAGTTVIGASFTDYVDNLVGTQLDPILTDLINSALAIPPDPEQMDGTWTGGLVVAKVDIPEGSEGKAEEANCLALFKQMEGKTIPLTIKLNATGGSASMITKDGSSQGKASYTGPDITMSFTQQGSTITMTGKAKLTKEGVTMGGTWRMPYQGSPITLSGTWTAVKN